MTFVGERWVADCTHADGGTLVVNLPGWGEVPGPGERLTIGWDPEKSVLLKANPEQVM